MAAFLEGAARASLAGIAAGAGVRAAAEDAKRLFRWEEGPGPA